MASVSKSLCCCVAVGSAEFCVLEARLSKRVAISLLTELSSFWHFPGWCWGAGVDSVTWGIFVTIIGGPWTERGSWRVVPRFRSLKCLSVTKCLTWRFICFKYQNCRHLQTAIKCIFYNSPHSVLSPWQGVLVQPGEERMNIRYSISEMSST